MNADRLLALYDRVAEAPDAVPACAASCWTSPCAGSWSSRTPADEPASELLKRIATEKARLVKAGEVGNREICPDGDAMAKPFEIPATWSWAAWTPSDRLPAGHITAAECRNFAQAGDGIPRLRNADLDGFSRRCTLNAAYAICLTRPATRPPLP